MNEYKGQMAVFLTEYVGVHCKFKRKRYHFKEEKNIVGRIIGNCYRIFVPGWT
jgi:hypothetical protein